jgi:hypothetical protein
MNFQSSFTAEFRERGFKNRAQGSPDHSLAAVAAEYRSRGIEVLVPKHGTRTFARKLGRQALQSMGELVLMTSFQAHRESDMLLLVAAVSG